MSKHTPGPLEVRSLEGVWSVFQAETLALTASCPDGATSKPSGIREISADEALANARLYAAAPDLLKTLKRAEVVVAETLRQLLRNAGMPESFANENPDLQMLRATIAKAEGREP